MSADADTLSDQAEATLARLMPHLHRQPDLPGLQRATRQVQRTARRDTSRVQNLVDAVADDPGLSARLLRLSNSVIFASADAGHNTSLDRAVRLLGFSAVQQLAAGLPLLDRQPDGPGAREAREDFLRALLAAQLARELSLDWRDTDAAHLIATFQNLGRMLVATHLPDDAQAIRKAAPRDSWPLAEREQHAALHRLGWRYDDLGLHVAQHWGWPEALRNRLRPAADGAPQHPNDSASRQRCLARLASTAPLSSADDLKFFTTPIAMQDLDAVRARLGAERINLVGASYGTRAALEYARQFPDRLRRSVLDGVAPPDMVLPTSGGTDTQAAFDAMLADCERSAACRRAHPTLRADWVGLLASLPKEVSAAHPLSGRRETFTLDRDRLLGTVRGPLYAPVLAAGLPQAISQAAAGRYEALLGLSSALSNRRSGSVAMGMHFSVLCAEDGPLLPAHNPVDVGMASTTAPFTDQAARLYQRACAFWPRGAVAAAFYRIPTASTASLLLSGGLDPATPPRHAERVARALGPKALHVVVPNAGHGLLGVGCVRDLMFRFIDAADDAAARAADASCVTGIPRPPAFEPINPAATEKGTR